MGQFTSILELALLLGQAGFTDQLVSLDPQSIGILTRRGEGSDFFESDLLNSTIRRRTACWRLGAGSSLGRSHLLLDLRRLQIHRTGCGLDLLGFGDEALSRFGIALLRGLLGSLQEIV